MPRSMTGFGRAVIDAPFGRFTVEIQSVNRKYFEIFLTLPKEFFRFENAIRKSLKEKVSRGHLHLRLQLISSAENVRFPDIETLKAVKQGWERIATSLGLDKGQITLSFISQMAPQEEKRELFEEEMFLEKCVDEALENLLRMKEEEGNALVQDIIQRL